MIGRFRGQFEITCLTVYGNVDLVFRQAERFHPECIVVADETLKDGWEDRLKPLGSEILWGREGLLEASGRGNEDLVVNALVGAVGLEATMRAVESGSSIALANKEVLVMAGELVTAEMDKRSLSLVPIDSEHSAIFQCLQGEDAGRVRRIILTASGGPFLNKTREELEQVTVEEALDHPNWSMGRKVTIDSASLMNKGLEVIEARWLFGLEPDFVDVVIHPQSIIHSMVEFVDGSIKAQLGVPDMRIPIAYALTWPDRWPGDYGTMDFLSARELTFLPPDRERFPALGLAYEALKIGGTAPCVLNGADELAVEAFLSGQIKFSGIPYTIEEALNRHSVVSSPDLEDILEADRWVRKVVREEILK